MAQFARFALILLGLISLTAAAQDRFNQRKTLEDGRLLVIQESAMEPSSSGSYTVKLYANDNPQSPYDEFIAGIICKREGILKSFILNDLDGDGTEEIIIVTQNGRSHGHLSANALKISHDTLVKAASVSGESNIQALLTRLEDMLYAKQPKSWWQ